VTGAAPRRAEPADVPACAAIVHAWVEATGWMPDAPPLETLTGHIRDAFPDREIWVVGAPVEGYVSVDPARGHIGALYCRRPGRGLGKLLLDEAKHGRDRLTLNAHEANGKAHRFYRREGFRQIDRVAEGTDGIPEIVMEWMR
jgi:putative acetyltransferase